jgi:dienelactone hydrolase
MARIGTELDAVVSFHGGIQPVIPAKKDNVEAFVLVCNGADDPFVTEEQITAFKEEMDSANVRYEFINYEGAKHSFTNPIADSVGKEFDMPLEYNEKADKESWEKMKSVFKKEFAEK